MQRLSNIKYTDLDDLYKMLESDENFKYNISEGAFYTEDGVYIGIYRDPYFGCLYAISETAERNIDYWKNYIQKAWNNRK